MSKSAVLKLTLTLDIMTFERELWKGLKRRSLSYTVKTFTEV